MIIGEAALAYLELVYHLEVLLDLWLLLDIYRQMNLCTIPSWDTLLVVNHSIVTSQLVFCNVIYMELPFKIIQKM